MSNSFYGGRRGAPFLIRKTFNSVKAMTDAFDKLDQYKEVAYGEYVIIMPALANQDDKNPSQRVMDVYNPDYGSLYRREYSGPVWVGKVGFSVANLPQFFVSKEGGNQPITIPPSIEDELKARAEAKTIGEISSKQLLNQNDLLKGSMWLVLEESIPKN